MNLVHIKTVLKKKSIIDYLAKKGFHPAKTLGGDKYAYYCPLPDHQDKKSPSFIVWTNAEYENFHCFGCQKNYSIIHLMMHMESISFAEALRRLSDDLDVSIHESIKGTLEEIDELLLGETKHYVWNLEFSQKLLDIGSLCRFYLESVKCDESECGIIDCLLAEVDKEILNCDFAGIDETVAFLPSMLRLRRENFEQQKIEKARAQYASR